MRKLNIVIVIDNILISDDVVEKQFVCDLSKCKGGCCEDGDAGAPLENKELKVIDEVYEKVKPYLTEPAIAEIEKKGPPYGIETSAVDGMNVIEVEKAARAAVEKIHATGKHYFLVCNTYRFRAHSMFDAELYRDKTEVEEWKKRDPITGLQRDLLSRKVIDEVDIKTLAERIETVIQKAVDFAEGGSWEPIEQLTKFVYSEKKS